jgi:hypothetical protein
MAAIYCMIHNSSTSVNLNTVQYSRRREREGKKILKFYYRVQYPGMISLLYLFYLEIYYSLYSLSSLQCYGTISGNYGT